MVSTDTFTCMRKKLQTRKHFTFLFILVTFVFFVNPFHHVKEQHTENDIRPNIVFGINTVERKRELLSALFQTWGSEENVVVTDCSNSSPHPRVKRIEASPCAEYPPVLSWINTFREMYDIPSDWYFKADDDTYVNLKRLRRLIFQLEAAGYSPDTFVYLGGFAPGREHEREKLGLSGQPFVMGGPGILLSRKAMQELNPVLEECMASHVASLHSDTQFARCVYSVFPGYTSANKDMITKYTKCFKAYYQKEGAITETKPFSHSTVPQVLQERDLSYVSLHSLKSAEDMFSVHTQVLKSSSRRGNKWCPV